MEYVEVRGKNVDVAVQAAIAELGAASTDEVVIEIVQEPERGFLGLGGRDAVVKVSRKPEEKKSRSRRRRRKKGEGGSKDGGQSPKSGDGGGAAGRKQSRDNQRSQQDGRGGSNRGGSSGGAGGEQKRGGQKQRDGSSTSKSKERSAPAKGDGGSDRSSGKGKTSKAREEKNVPIEEQVPIVEEFLSGLVDAFGLEGEVSVSIDEDVIIAEITGEQTESMVGNRGSVIEAIHELTKTVMHRKMQAAARLRLDIAGYAERRRRALRIYADQLIDQVLSEGGEIMLEPMSAADRKVIHDSVADRNGVRSYSEGEAPQRFVVIQNTDSDSSEEE